MFLGIAVAGVGFEHLISLDGGHHMSGAEGWILCAAAALLMSALTCIGATAGSSMRRVAGQLGLTVTAAGLGAVAADLHRVAVVLTLLLLCVGQTLLGRESKPRSLQ